MKNLLIILAIFILNACGGVPKKTPQTNQDAIKLSKKYTKQIEYVNSDNRRSFNQLVCPTDIKTLKDKKWTLLLDYANACVSRKQWKMVETIGRKLTEDTSFSPWGAYYLSIVAEVNGQMDRAFWLIELSLKKSPQMAILYYQKGRLHWKNKEYGLSVENFEKSIDLNIGIVEPHMFLAQIYFRDQELKMAKMHYEKALAIDSRTSEALIGLAKLYKIQGDPQNEQKYLEKAQQVNPKNKWVNKELTKFLAKASSREPANGDIKSNGDGQ
ncbi:MAG: hypothetical protein KDD58_01110 [Bdellovibrionales bacterium]|nr:hypothetical protein [Bdellovibrionales bacterium]